MVLRTAGRAVLIAVGTMFVGLVGALLGISKVNVTMAVVLRTVLVIALLLAMASAARVSDRKATDHAGRSPQQVLIAAGLAYVLNLSSWQGRTLFGQLLVSPGVFSALVDFVVWMAVALVAVRLGDRMRAEADQATAPYA